jgi:hypothetical protein
VDRCALFVDAGYALSDGALAVHGTRHRDSVSWDYAGLVKLLAELSRDRTGMPVLRCYWYEATEDSNRTPEHETLADIPGLKLRLGKVRPGRREGVETEIRRDLTALARNKAVSDVVIVSAEEDLAQVISDVQDQGIKVAVVHVAGDGGWTVSRALRQECDDVIEISAGHLRPYVDLIPGAEPAARDDESALGFPARTTSAQPQPAAAQAGPPALYPAPVSHEFPRAVPPPGPPPQPIAQPAAQNSGATMIGQPSAAASAGPVGPRSGGQPAGEPGATSLGPVGATAALAGPLSSVPMPPAGGDSGSAGSDSTDPGRPGQGMPRFDDQSRMPAHQQYHGVESLHSALPPSGLGQPSQPGQVQAGPQRGGPPQGMHASGPLHSGPQQALPPGGPGLGGPPQNGQPRGSVPAPGPGDPAQAGGPQGPGFPHGGPSQNGLSRGGQSQNGMPHSGLPLGGMPQNGLPQNGLSQNGLPPSGLSHGGGVSHNGLAQGGPPQNGLSQGGLNGVSQNGLPPSGFGQHAAGPAAESPRNGELPRTGEPPRGGGHPQHAAPSGPQQQRQLPPGQYQPGMTSSYSQGQHQAGQGQPTQQGPGPQGQFGGYSPPGQGFGQQNSGSYDSPQLPAAIQPPMPQPVAIALPEAVQAAHAEGFGFGETVARDAPALWLEAVLARKPRMPSDLEARLLQGSALPIDSLLHDEVRHALRRGFWDALERSRR